MKARPRSVENQVADALNVHFERLGMTKVERIPVLGRTGPDISLNELKLVVDVKSRLQVPQTLFFPILGPFRFGEGHELMGVRLSCLFSLWDVDSGLDWTAAVLDYKSKTVRDYLDHMELWTAANVKQGVSCIIAHRPKMPIGDAVAIIYSTSRRILIDNARQHYNNSISTLSSE